MRLNKRYAYLLSLVLAFSLMAVQTSALADVTRDDNSALAQKLKLPIYQWQSDSKPMKAIIVTIHGATLHAGTFDNLATHLADEGFLVTALDLRGYGRWRQGDVATTDQVPGEKSQVDYQQAKVDLTQLLTKLKADHPDLKLYCLGESIGANMAITLAAKNPQCVDGLILVSPCVKRVRHLGARALFDISRGIADPLCPIALEPYIARYLSNDERVTDNYLKDPLCVKRMCLFDLLATVLTNEEGVHLAAELPAHLPVLVIAGEEDKIYKASAVPEFMHHLASDKQTTYIVPQEGHLLVETPYISKPVISHIDGWLTENTDSEQVISLSPSASATLDK